MQVTLNKTYRSVSISSERIGDLVKYLQSRSQNKINFEIKLQGDESIETDEYVEFNDELKDIYDWRLIDRIRITQGGFGDKDALSLYLNFNASLIPEGCHIQLRHNDRMKASGHMQEIVRKLQIKSNINWLTFEYMAFLVDIPFILLLVLQSRVLTPNTLLQKYLIFVTLFIVIVLAAFSITGLGKKIYKVVLLHDESGNRFSGRYLSKDLIRFLMFLLTTIFIPLLIPLLNR